MGSMSKVMQKLREAAADAGEAEQSNANVDEAADVLAGGPASEAARAAEADAVSETVDGGDGQGGERRTTSAFTTQAPQHEGEDGEPVLPGASGFVPGEATPAESYEASGATAYADDGYGAATVADTMGGAFDDTTIEWNAARVDPVVVPFHNRYSAVCEQYRSVRARLLTMNAARAQQVLVVSSSIPEEGKSVTTVNLSLVMAEGGEHRILLVDGDFRRGAVARMLGIPSQPGFADVLRGDIALEEALQPTPFPNLKVLPAGQVKNGAYSELLSGPATANVLEEFRAAFDYSIVDTPPITTVSDVCQLAPHCEGALVVVEMRRTPEPTVQQAVRTLQSNNVKILGCVLSRFRDRGAGYYEHYYSSYYQR